MNGCWDVYGYPKCMGAAAMNCCTCRPWELRRGTRDVDPATVRLRMRVRRARWRKVALLLCLALLAGCRSNDEGSRGDYTIRAVDDDGDSIRGYRITVQCDSLVRDPIIVRSPTAIIIECAKPTYDNDTDRKLSDETLRHAESATARALRAMEREKDGGAK
jgi:hypothetical protein